MSPKEQADALLNDLRNLLNRYGEEFDLSYVQVMGALEMVKMDVFQAMMDEELDE